MATIRFVLEPKVDEAIPKVEQRSDSVQIKCSLLATGGKKTQKSSNGFILIPLKVHLSVRAMNINVINTF